MFPIAHAYLLRRIVSAPTLAHFLGCVWPDMLFESPLSHPQSHRSGAELARFAEALSNEAERDEFQAFVTGVLTHGSEPRGFDWYSDEEWGGKPLAEKGYAFQHGQAIAERAATACGVALELGWWKAHNIVEIAFERPLYAADAELGRQLEGACMDLELMRRVAVPLAAFFQLAAEELVTPMRRFREVVQLHPVDAVASARTYALQVRLKHPGAEPDEAAIAALIEEAEREIASDRDAYLDECVERVGAMLRTRPA